MTGRTSQKGLSRDPLAGENRRRRAVLSMLTGLAFLAVLFMAVDHFPGTELGRTIDAHLTRLADPQSWVP